MEFFVRVSVKTTRPCINALDERFLVSLWSPNALLGVRREWAAFSGWPPAEVVAGSRSMRTG